MNATPVGTVQPRPGIITRIKRYFVAADLDEAEAAGRPTPQRLPDPLPISVRTVAIGQMVANGLGVAGVTVALVFTAGAAVAMPFAFGGRQSVGLSMGLVFAFLVLAILAIVPCIGFRAAARILRRERRGVRTVRRLAVIAAVFSVFGSTVAIGLLFIMQGQGWTGGRSVLSAATSLAFNAWSAFVLQRYERELDTELGPLPEVMNVDSAPSR